MYSLNYCRCNAVHIRQVHSVANCPRDYALCYGDLYLVGVESCTECDKRAPRLDLLMGKRMRSKAARKRRCYFTVWREFDIPESSAVLHTVAYLTAVI